MRMSDWSGSIGERRRWVCRVSGAVFRKQHGIKLMRRSYSGCKVSNYFHGPWCTWDECCGWCCDGIANIGAIWCNSEPGTNNVKREKCRGIVYIGSKCVDMLGHGKPWWSLKLENFCRWHHKFHHDGVLDMQHHRGCIWALTDVYCCMNKVKGCSWLLHAPWHKSGESCNLVRRHDIRRYYGVFEGFGRNCSGLWCFLVEINVIYGY